MNLDDNKAADSIVLVRTVTSFGQMYEGQEKDSQPHGYGRYFFEKGNVYVGEFKDGKKHGQGGWYDASGEQYKTGNYVDDQLQE